MLRTGGILLVGTFVAFACAPAKSDGDDGTSSGTATNDGTTTGGGGTPTGGDDGGTSDSSDGGATTGTSGGSGTTDSTSDSTSSRPYECPNGVLENDPLPFSVDGNTVDGFAEQGAICDNGGTIGPELVYTFTTPAEGFYEFTTTAEETYTDTVIFLTEGETCGGKQIACGDDTSVDADNIIATTNVATWLYQDEIIQVVVDTKRAAGAEFTLTADSVEGVCPDEVIEETVLPFTVSGSTTGQPNRMTSTCFGEASDYIYQWTAPQAATYQIDTIGSSATHEDTVLSVIDGDSCGGEELACNDDVTAGTDRDAKLEVDLVADQTVIIVVDGWSGAISGDFVLNFSIV